MRRLFSPLSVFVAALAVAVASSMAVQGQTVFADQPPPKPGAAAAPESVPGSAPGPGAGDGASGDGPAGLDGIGTVRATGATGATGAAGAAGAIDYGEMRQPGRVSPVSATLQGAWDEAPDHAGVADLRLCAACVYRVRTRELMVSTLVLPEDRTIERIDVGDSVGFEVRIRGSNLVVVRPRSFGIDTNMNIYTDKGVMAFYLRSEGFDSGHVPDLVVRIGQDGLGGDLAGDAPAPPAFDGGGGTGATPPAREAVPGLPAWPASGGPAPAFGDGHAFDPAELRGWGDYSLRGSETLRPETVFRDDHFTYVHFGDRWREIELPVAFVVIDGIDETVNTRVAGQTLVVESTSPLISLKSGESFLCIEYQGGR